MVLGSGVGIVATTTFTCLSDFNNIGTDMFAGCFCEMWQAGGSKERIRITANSTSQITLASAPTGGNGTYYFNIVSYWWDNATNYDCHVVDTREALVTTAPAHTGRTNQDVIEANWKYSIFHHNWGFYAPIYLVDDAETHTNWIGVSTIDGNGNYNYDAISTYISLQDYGVTTITGLGRLIDSLIIFSETDIHKLNISSGNQFSWSLEETLQDVGCVAPDSLALCVGDNFKNSGYYYVSRDGIRVYDGYKSYLVSYPIQQNDDYPIGVTTLSEARGVYDDRNKQYVVSFPADEVVYKYDLRTGEWLGDMDYPDEVDWWTVTHDGELLGTDGTKIVVFDDDGSAPLTDYDGEDIDPVWKSKVYDFGSPGVEKILQEVSITYKSNTQIEFTFYVDRSSTESTMNNDPFEAATSKTTKHVGFPIGTRGTEFEFQISLDSSYTGTNTYIEIDEIRVYYTYAQSGRELGA